MPPGFVYIPTGPAACGGDPQAYLPLRRQVAHVPGFFLARREVTFREYLEFLNDPETLDRLATRDPLEKGVKLLVDSRDPDIQRILPVSGYVELIPHDIRQVVLVEQSKGAGEYHLKPDYPIPLSLDQPAVGIPPVAGLEYARWLSKRHGGRWLFRLPNELEWEKAARGVDRRIFVWGSYPEPIYAYCNSSLGLYRRGNQISETGTHPLDESIYGVLDLAGSAKEPVLTPAGILQAQRWATVRGGSWDDTHYMDFHAASRNRHPAVQGYRYVGLRLAADIPPQ